MVVVPIVAALTATWSGAAVTVTVIGAVASLMPATTADSGVRVGATVTVGVIAAADMDVRAGGAVSMAVVPSNATFHFFFILSIVDT